MGNVNSDIDDQLIIVSQNSQIQTMETENDNLRSKILDPEDEELESVNLLRSAKESHLEAKNKELEELVANLKTSSQQEKTQLGAEIQEQKFNIELLQELSRNFRYRLREQLETISNLKESSLQEKIQLEAQIQEKEKENHKLKSIIKEHEEVLANLQISSLVEKIQLEAQIQEKEKENHEQNSKIEELEELLTNLQQEHLKTRVPMESSVDDVIDVKADEKEILPSESQDNGKNTGEKWKKGLLIGGGCAVVAVALWKYGPDVAGIASALNRTRLFGNLF